MRFERAWADTSYQRESFEVDRFGEVTTKPVEHANKVGGQRGFRDAANGPVALPFTFLVAFGHPPFMLSKGCPPYDFSIWQRYLHSAAGIA